MAEQPVDPFELFNNLFAEAQRREEADPTAVALATASKEAVPSLRMVLLKGVDDRGFTFFTNLNSRKGGELAQNPQAALCFYWDRMGAQIRIEGPVEPVSREEADAYFASRPRLSRVGAWASEQSRPMETPFELEKRVAKFAAKFAIGEVPRPEHWSGFRLIPSRMEFWRRGAFRLHERNLYVRQGEGWAVSRLYP